MNKIIYFIRNHRSADVALIVLISLVAVSKWFNFELPKGHDAIADMLTAQAAKVFIFDYHMLPGWTDHWFMGYPMFIIHPPLVHYLIIAFSFPFGWVLGTKLLYLSFFILSGVFAYYYAYELTKNRLASFASGLAYTFIPYHILDVGFEGHQGCFGMPYMLTPLLLLSIERLIKKPGAKYVLITTAVLSALILTYAQIFPFLIGPFVILYTLFRLWVEGRKRTRYFRAQLTASTVTLCLAMLVSAFWWFPLLWERKLFYASEFSVDQARAFSSTFAEAISLRPDMCCARSSAFGESGSVIVEIIRILPFVLVLFGVILNYKNRYVWFFFFSILISLGLALGPSSPVNIYAFAHRFVPFFSGIRTPDRFLMFATISQAVLIGFFVKSLTDRLKHTQIKRLIDPNIKFIVLVVVCLIMLGNTWQETWKAYGTIELPKEEENALNWLEEQENGDYRITNPPFFSWAQYPGIINTVNPTYWTFLHDKETLYAAIPAVGVKYTGDIIDLLNKYMNEDETDIGSWLTAFNVKYVLLDKNNPLYDNILLGDGFELVWSEKTLEIYENHNIKPRIYAFTLVNERQIELYNENKLNLEYIKGTQDAILSLDKENTLSHDFSVKSVYDFNGSWIDSLYLQADLYDIDYNRDDAIHLSYYSEKDLPDIVIRLDLFDSEGIRYFFKFGVEDGIKAGWNEITLPVSMLINNPMPDEDDADCIDDNLDLTSKIVIGIMEKENVSKPHEFELYFDDLSIVSQQINNDLEYTKIRQGKYEVNVDTEEPAYLVLSESYHPNWAASYNGGDKIDSEMIYESLNCFYLEEGTYSLTLEYKSSTQRKAGNIISGISIIMLCLSATYLLIRKKTQVKDI